MRPVTALALLAGALFAGVVPPGSAQAQQATGDRATTAYGARTGVRNERPDSPGVSEDIRLSPRLATRIDSRITMRIERYADPRRALWAYASAPDDGSRRPATVTIAPRRTAPSEPAIFGDTPGE